MTLRKSIIFSLALHMLLFGAGFAFARFGGELFWLRHEPVMVTLVGKGGTSSTSRQRKRDAASRIRPAKQDRSWPAPEQKSPTPEAGSLQQPDREHMPVLKDARGVAGGEADKSSGTGQPAGSPSGAVSSEQWAIIVTSIERVKNYPRLARERGIEGVVHLRFRLKPQGQVEKVEIVKSSGYDVLDTASIRTVYRAAPMPYVNGWVEVPMAYVLK